jgi:hypothetical protein
MTSEKSLRYMNKKADTKRERKGSLCVSAFF